MGALAATGTLLASLTPFARADGDPRLAFERYQLPNGLGVILHKDGTMPLAYVSVWYAVGSGDEVPGRSGFAHLFEHLMFQGSTHVGQDKHVSTLKQVGASSVSGTTSTYRTNYFEEIPSNQLETALWLESDRMGYFLPLLTQKSFDNQREVVRNERRQRVDNVPYGKSRAIQAQLLYGEGHPYRHLIIGRHEDLMAASVEDARQFFRRWYVPANATLLVAGDIDIGQTKKLIDKWFGSFPRGPRPPHKAAPPPSIRGTRRQTVVDDFAKLRRVSYAWHTPRAFAPGDSELAVLAGALGREGTGRLYRSLVHEKQWAQNVTVYQQSQGHSSIFQVMVDLEPGADLARVEQALDAELERIRTDPVSERERRRVVTEIEADVLRDLENLGARGELMQEYNHFLGDPGALTRHLDSFRQSTPQAIRDHAARYLSRDRRVEIVVFPAGSPGAGNEAVAVQPAVGQGPAPVARVTEAPVPALEFPTEEAFRKQAPAPMPERPLRAPRPEQFKLPNGIAVLLVPRQTVPILSLSLVFDGGAALDPRGKEGLASVCSEVMTQRTGTLDRVALAEALADVASRVDSGASTDQHWVGMTTLRRHVDATLDLWAETLLRPVMRKDDLDRHLKRRAAGLDQLKGNPVGIADRVAGSLVWGLDHPLGRLETRSSLSNITLADCQAFVANRLKPGGTQLFVVGDITKEELIRKVWPRLAAWKGRSRVSSRSIKPRPPRGRIFFVDMPNAAQSVVQLMHRGPPRKAPDFQSTSIMAAILGGSFTSRINMNIRQKHGYAYRARGDFRYNRLGSTFSAGAQVRANATKESILEILKEIRGMREVPPTAEELVREKNGKVLALPAHFATGGQTLAAFRDLVYHGLPLDYFEKLVPQLQAVDGAAVSKAAASHLKVDDLRLLVVGDARVVMPKLKELASEGHMPGEVIVLDADGRPIPQ